MIAKVLVPWLMMAGITVAQPLDHIRVSDDATHFVHSNSGKRFVVWGVNYDHDSSGRLLDEYWIDEWKTVVEDFREIKALGANCVRIHLQVGKLMDAPNRAAPPCPRSACQDRPTGGKDRSVSRCDRAGMLPQEEHPRVV